MAKFSASPSEVEGLCRAKSRLVTLVQRVFLDFARNSASTSLGKAGVGSFLLIVTPLHAQSITTSSAPDTASISIYRNPDRPPDQRMVGTYLGGYALITETRRIELPDGDGIVRFEGVSNGILPESAIVTGLPEGVSEKNEDAHLLSPAGLLGASTGRRVTLRRTSRATGAVREQEAVIRSGPQGQVVLQTKEGFEALRCTGLNETIVYPALPEGLTAKPTLSVRTHSPRAMTATVTLSYLAEQFDWQANYVATLADDGQHLDLFAWVTLASGDTTNYPHAQAMVIAGRPNRGTMRGGTASRPPSLDLQCWPGDTTSDIDETGGAETMAPSPLPPPPAPVMMESIMVTARAAKPAMMVRQEDLGDLKLYRIPEPVTVAAQSQKQVALLDHPRVPVSIVWRADVSGDEVAPVRALIRAHNRLADNLGLPLPAGKVAVFTHGLLLGETSLADKTVGEDVEIDAAGSTTVIARAVRLPDKRMQLAVTNANLYAVAFEARIGEGRGFSGKVVRKDGRWLWKVVVAPGGQAELIYRGD